MSLPPRIVETTSFGDLGMSLIGKILTVLNVLAALAFFYLASVDWGKRQAWADAAMRHELVSEGLPVDENDVDAEGRSRLANLRAGAVTELFSKVGGNPPNPPSQTKELKDLMQKVEQRLDNPDVKGTKEQKLARLLLPLARTDAERQELLRRMAKPTGEDGDLESRLRKAFTDALNTQFTAKSGDPTQPPNEQLKNRERDQRRRAVAALLFAWTEALKDDEGLAAEAGLGDSRTYERFRTVVGLEAARQAVDAHSQTLQAIASTIRQDLLNDRINFDVAFADLMRQVHAESLRVARQKDTLRIEAEKAAQHADLADAREKEVKRVEKQLEEARQVTKEKLARQSKVEKDLFDARQKQRDTFDDNQKLEKKIRILEQGIR